MLQAWSVLAQSRSTFEVHAESRVYRFEYASVKYVDLILELHSGVCPQYDSSLECVSLLCQQMCHSINARAACVPMPYLSRVAHDEIERLHFGRMSI